MSQWIEHAGQRFELATLRNSVGVVDEAGEPLVNLPIPRNELHKVGVVGHRSVQWLAYENLSIWSPAHDDVETVRLDRTLRAEAVAGGEEALAVLASYSISTGVFRVEPDGSTALLVELRQGPRAHERKLVVADGFVVWALDEELCCVPLSGGEEQVIARAGVDEGFEDWKRFWKTSV